MPIGTCEKLWHLTSQCLDSEANHTTVASVCAHDQCGTLVCAHDTVVQKKEIRFLSLSP